MAMKRYRTAAALIGISYLVVFPNMVFGFAPVRWTVGGEDGTWGDPNFDYQAWADHVRFYAGDELLFNYDPTYSNVVVAVSQDDFDQCIYEPNYGVYYSGQDTLVLTDVGNYYFMCEGLCESGTKFIVRAKQFEGNK
ncbi:basic blue protein-like [Argentina anserina]|uniref:basic blue protein-like n=1 Tax=Argentina anserina TaxID=57926 RepID=UPI00217631BB|nr:basic blue protein-like [Potentilla anserina]